MANENINKKIALLTGAGSTVPFGMPDMRSFLELFENQLIENDPPLYGYLMRFKELMSHFSNEDYYLHYDLEGLLRLVNNIVNLENFQSGSLLLDLLFTDLDLDNRPLAEERLLKLIHDLKQIELLIKDQIHQIYGKENTDSDVFEQIIKEFKITNVFTTNYDLVLEEELERENYNVYDGFSSVGASNYWNMQNYFDFSKSTIPNVINLYKLHGSANWFLKKESDKIIKSPISLHSRNNDIQNMIIYPFEKSYRRFVPFGLLFNCFREVLLKTDTLIILGFSMRDFDINEIIETCMKDNPKLKVIIWNPAVKGIIKYLADNDLFLHYTDRIDSFHLPLTANLTVTQENADDLLAWGKVDKNFYEVLHEDNRLLTYVREKVFDVKIKEKVRK